MKEIIEIYDPAMCCSTGVCGTSVDDTLADFANDLKWLKSKNIEIRRFNLGQEPEAFKSNPQVLARLQKEGTDVLPVILVNNEVTSEGGYPGRDQLCAWLGIEVNDHIISNPSEVQTDLIQNLRQSFIHGDDASLRAQFESAKESGIDIPALAEAMQAGLNKRHQITQQLILTANELLGMRQNGCTMGGGCC